MKIPGHPRIEVRAGVCGGKPQVRGMRMRVIDILEMLASGMSQEEILADFPYVEREGILACLAYAAADHGHPIIMAA